jgi:hypothetical protein
MAFTKRSYSKKQIDKAGNQLVASGDGIARVSEESMNIIHNWRICHVYPLHIVYITLRNRAKKIRGGLVYQRQKRLESIQKKLKQNKNMVLSQMQDIGGCRAVLPVISDVKKLISIYEKSQKKKPTDSKNPDRPICVNINDYIKKPKLDGYRSYHLIFKFYSKHSDKKDFNGQRVEIQIRSKLQHAWATAVEIFERFTKKALKSKIKSTDAASLLKFFLLMSSAIAFREKCAPVPNTPTDKNELLKELRSLVEQEKIIESLRAWSSAVAVTQNPTRKKEDAFYLLKLDVVAGQLEIVSFRKQELQKAENACRIAEKSAGSNIDVVLVSVADLDDLPKAYPNYYADTSLFIRAIEDEIGSKGRI